MLFFLVRPHYNKNSPKIKIQNTHTQRHEPFPPSPYTDKTHPMSPLFWTLPMSLMMYKCVPMKKQGLARDKNPLQTGTLPLVHSHVYCSCMRGVYFSVQFTLFPLPKCCPALPNLICWKKFKVEVGSKDFAAWHARKDVQPIVFLYAVKLYQSSLLNRGKSLLTAQFGHIARSPNH